MKRYGSTADTRNRRRWIFTRWKKITDIAFSSTVNASALKNTIVTSSTPPITSRWSRNLRSSATSVVRLARHDEREIVVQRREQPLRIDDVRQHDHDQDQQRDQREQRVVRHGAREQQPLVRLERLQHLQREGERILEDPRRARERGRGSTHPVRSRG